MRLNALKSKDTIICVIPAIILPLLQKRPSKALIFNALTFSNVVLCALVAVLVAQLSRIDAPYRRKTTKRTEFLEMYMLRV